MERIKIMLNGLPGNVANVIARHAMNDPRIELLPYTLTGPEIDAAEFHINNKTIELVHPQERQTRIRDIIAREAPLICVDFTHPSAVNDNAAFYAEYRLPFVMGTTGGDRNKLAESVTTSTISAVIAPNMGKQIVAFQALMAYAAENFPDLFKGYHLAIRESHQAGKADTSGTARAMVRYFNQMGIPFSEDQIEKERDPERQQNMWGVHPDYLGGHAWHTYTLISADQTVKFEFTHNVDGREIYGEGTMDAVAFLADKVAAGSRGEVFSMIDVLKAAAHHEKT
jgi:4-hydroxy-tetrahydrodipicolinate reductase